MSVDGVSAIVSFASWVIYVLIDCRHPSIGYWQSVLARTTATCSLPLSDYERQRNINSFSCCIFGHRGIARIFTFITESLTTLVSKSNIYQRYNTDSKWIDIASCKACKNISSVVENAILIWYCKQTPKTRALFEFMDGPFARPADNPPDSEGLGFCHWTVPKLTVRVHPQPVAPT